MEEAPEPHYLETENGRIAWWRTCEDGCEDNIPVVMVHGGPGDGCDPTKGERMLLGRPVFQYDQLGCGMSDPIKDLGSWTAADYADELDSFLVNTVKERCILVGASWGAGLICQYLYRYGSAKIAAVILISPYLSTEIWVEDMVSNLKDMSDDAYLKAMDYVHGRGSEESFRKLLGEYYAKYLFSKPCNREIAVASALEGPNPVFRKMWGECEMVCTGTLKDFDVTSVLPELNIPVLYMCGDSDQVTIPTMISYRNSTPGSSLSIVQNAGHALSFEQFDIYRQCILSFIGDLGL